jgi:hypothetical protein
MILLFHQLKKIDKEKYEIMRRMFLNSFFKPNLFLIFFNIFFCFFEIINFFFKVFINLKKIFCIEVNKTIR